MPRIAHALPKKGILHILAEKMEEKFRVKNIKRRRGRPRKEKSENRTVLFLTVRMREVRLNI